MYSTKLQQARLKNSGYKKESMSKQESPRSPNIHPFDTHRNCDGPFKDISNQKTLETSLYSKLYTQTSKYDRNQRSSLNGSQAKTELKTMKTEHSDS